MTDSTRSTEPPPSAGAVIDLPEVEALPARTRPTMAELVRRALDADAAGKDPFAAVGIASDQAGSVRRAFLAVCRAYRDRDVQIADEIARWVDGDGNTAVNSLLAASIRARDYLVTRQSPSLVGVGLDVVRVSANDPTSRSLERVSASATDALLEIARSLERLRTDDERDRVCRAALILTQRGA